MIFAIGDIHGALDPLRLLIEEICQICHLKKIPVKDTKLIFLGDYIDHGPSSRQVIDFIKALPFQKVFLLGNHEAIMLDTIDNNSFFQKYGNIWFRNGGKKTVISMLRPGEYENIGHFLQRKINYEVDDINNLPPFARKFSPAIIDFLRNLRPSHQEKIKKCGYKKNLLFTHALPSESVDLELQLSWNNHADFCAYYEKQVLFPEQSLLWAREPLKEAIKDTIVVHGHTPTHLIKPKVHTGAYNPESLLPFLHFKTPTQKFNYNRETGILEIYDCSMDDLISINIDTGSVYGKRLTALQVDEAEITSYQQLNFLQIDSGAGYRKSNNVYTLQIKLYSPQKWGRRKSGTIAPPSSF